MAAPLHEEIPIVGADFAQVALSLGRRTLEGCFEQRFHDVPAFDVGTFTHRDGPGMRHG
jgi:hypothetical protein